MEISTTIDLGQVAQELELPAAKVRAAVELLDDGNTVPFITRYRKDQTGGLDEEQIRNIQDRIARLRALHERKQSILKTLETRGKLTEELQALILAARTMSRLEDIYLPLKPKKQTLADLARQRGLLPLAEEVLRADPAAADLRQRAEAFLQPDAGLTTVDDVLQGVRHIVAEKCNEDVELRDVLRRIFKDTSRLVSTRAEEDADAAHHHDADEDSHEDSHEDASQQVESQESVRASTSEEISSPESPEARADGSASEDEQQAAHDLPFDDDFTDTEVDESDDELDAGHDLDVAEDADDEPAASDEHAPAVGDDASAPAPVAETAEPTAIAPDTADGDSVPLAAASPPTIKPLLPPIPATRVAAKRTVLKQLAAQSRKDAKRKQRERKIASFKDYFQYTEPLAKLPPHRLLAINRGERSKILKVKIEADAERLLKRAEEFLVSPEHPHVEFLRGCVRDALMRLILPGLEREVRRDMTDKAELHAVQVFVRNLRQLLLQPPVRDQRVLAIDPGFRSGCKIVALDEYGNVLGHTVIHIIGKDEVVRKGRETVVEMIRLYHIPVVAIGNGTACRETEKFVADILANELAQDDVKYVIVNEAGASVYSTSTMSREELPGFDPVLRSAVSIGRRLQDPLSELVKINPANIGVGMYQHDVKSKHLHDSLDSVVESCVNFVGVDVNSASPSLLRYISGLNQLTARRLYEHRQKHGPFTSREQFRNVPGFGEATFTQAAGFLKITNGENPLDATWIHPESYEIARRVIDQLGGSVTDLVVPTKNASARNSNRGAAAPTEPEIPVTVPSEIAGAPINEVAPDGPTTDSCAPETAAPEETNEPLNAAMPVAVAEACSSRTALADLAKHADVAQMSQQLGVGEHLLRDILTSLTRPGRDPREDLPPPIFRREVMKLEDLQPGMELTGTVLNVVDFGAFVDIGLSDSGLIHISRLADRYIRDPHSVVSVGDVLNVWVVEVDRQRRRVSLTAIKPGTERPPEKRSEKPPAEESRPPRPRPFDRKPPAAGQRDEGRAARTARPPKPQTPRPTRPPKPPAPVKPITKGMVEGVEPMRSFSDLLQFYEKKSTDDDQPKSKS